jgi:hypothetical protein
MQQEAQEQQVVEAVVVVRLVVEVVAESAHQELVQKVAVS